MTKKTIAIIGALISTVSTAANAQEIIQSLQRAGAQQVGRNGQFELGVDHLYSLTQVAQKSGLEITVVGTSRKAGKVQVQIGNSSIVSQEGIKVFTPKTVEELNMIGDVVVN